jgi:hypothetical protein
MEYAGNTWLKLELTPLTVDSTGTILVGSEMLLVSVGLRREELLWLTHDDLDLSAGKHGMIWVRAKEIQGEAWEPR